jgi:hypothetical protein
VYDICIRNILAIATFLKVFIFFRFKNTVVPMIAVPATVEPTTIDAIAKSIVTGVDSKDAYT